MSHTPGPRVGRKCDICHRRSGSITSFLTAMTKLGMKPKTGYAHVRCFERAKATGGAQ